MAREKKQVSSNGKGDKPRKVDGDKYRDNYDRIFKGRIKSPLNPSDEKEVEDNGK